MVPLAECCCVVVELLSHVQLFVTPWTIAHQSPLSMGFPKQEYWSGFPFPSPEDLPDRGIEWGSPALQADSLPAELPGKPKLCVKEYSLSPQVFVECGFFVCLFVCFFLGRVCILETQWAKY